MEKTRVLLYVNVLDRGGTESFIFSYLECFDWNLFTVDFLLTRDQAEAHEQDLHRLGCEKIVIATQKAGKWRQYIAIYRGMRRLLSQNEYQVVHFQSNPPGILATAPILAARRARIPQRILHSHGAGGGLASYGVLRPLITRLCRAVNCACCNRFMAPSMEAARYGFGIGIARRGGFELIRNTVRVERFAFSEEHRAHYRKELALNGKLVVGTIGRFSAVKNHALMLDVFAALLKRRGNAALLLVGGDIEAEPDVRAQLVEKAGRLGIEDQVIFYGESTDTPGLLSCMDVFLFPSIAEALGIAAIEAQIAGLPVLAASDGIPRELDISGNVIWRRLSHPPDAWADAIVEAAGSGRRQIDVRDERVAAYDARHTARMLQKAYVAR